MALGLGVGLTVGGEQVKYPINVTFSTPQTNYYTLSFPFSVTADHRYTVGIKMKVTDSSEYSSGTSVDQESGGLTIRWKRTSTNPDTSNGDMYLGLGDIITSSSVTPTIRINHYMMTKIEGYINLTDMGTNTSYP